MKRRFLLLILLVFTLIFTGCALINDKVEETEVETQVGTETETEREKETIKEESKSEQVSEYPGINVSLDSFYNENMSYSYFNPTVDSEQIDKVIQDYLNVLKENFIQEADEFYSDRLDNWTSNLHVNLDIFSIDEEKQVYSLLFTEDKLLAGSNNEKTYRTFNMDILNDKIYAMEDLLSDFEGFKNVLKEQVYNQDYEVDDELFNDYMTNVQDFNYFIENGTLKVAFDAYSIASGDQGSIIVDMPSDSIKDFLNEEGKHLLGIEETQAETEAETQAETQTEAETVEEPVADAPSQEITPLPGPGSYIALTFDDGPHATNTPRLLDILDKYNVKATFFNIGKSVEVYPSITADLVRRGHEIGNHSYSHPNLTNLSYDQIVREIQATDNAIINATGVKPRLMRPPYGARNQIVDQAIADTGHILTLWSVDTRDWESHNPQAILEQVKAAARPGAIILMHDIHSTTIDAVPAVIEYLQGQGYTLVTASQLP